LRSKQLWQQPEFREAVMRGRAAIPRKTHCKWGHEFTPDNTYWGKTGSRQCKACTTRRASERRRRRPKD
jgi:hypothetical protein